MWRAVALQRGEGYPKRPPPTLRGACRHDEGIDLAARLPPDLSSRAALVRAHVGEVLELVGVWAGARAEAFELGAEHSHAPTSHLSPPPVHQLPSHVSCTWSQNTEPGRSLARRRATLTALSSEAMGAGLTTSTSAPSARIIASFSPLVSSGTTSRQPYPRARATSARLTPVLPEVASTRVPPGASAPEASASCTMAAATRSLLDPPGLENSALARIVHRVARESERKCTSGVFPIMSITLSHTTVGMAPGSAGPAPLSRRGRRGHYLRGSTGTLSTQLEELPNSNKENTPQNIRARMAGREGCHVDSPRALPTEESRTRSALRRCERLPVTTQSSSTAN